MKKYVCFVGIDVSKSKLDITFLTEPSQKNPRHFVVSNDSKGIQQILLLLKKENIDLKCTLFSFEDTGVYSLPLCFFLSEKQLSYWMIPAIEIKRSKGISRGKTDKSDSKDIAFYSCTHLHKLRAGSIAEKEIMQLKLLFTEREKAMKALRLLESTMEASGFIPKDILQSVKKINTAGIRSLEKMILQLDNKIKEIISSCEAIKTQVELICSIPGVGPQTALYLIIATKGFKAFENCRKLACYAGVAPFEYSSGSSIKGRTKVNNLADKKMKSLLYMCAMNAKKCDKELSEYYNRKVEEGKSKMLVLNNISCKLLGRVFAVINRGTPFVNTYKFAA
jgi:transposase